MMSGYSMMIMITLLELIFGVSQFHTSNLAVDVFAERMPNFEKKPHFHQISNKAGQTLSVFKMNTASAPNGRHSFDPWGGKKRSEVGKNVSNDQDSSIREISLQGQNRKLLSSHQNVASPSSSNDDIGCEPGDFIACGLKQYETVPNTGTKANSVTEEIVPYWFNDGIKYILLHSIKKNFNPWGGKRSVGVSYPIDSTKLIWGTPKDKEGKLSPEFLNKISNYLLSTSRGSYKSPISENFNKLPEYIDTEFNINKLKKEDDSVLNSFKIKRGDEWNRKNSDKIWKDESNDNVRNKAEKVSGNFDDLLNTMDRLNSGKEKNEINSKSYASSSPIRNLRSFEPWAGKRSNFEPLAEKFLIGFPSLFMYESSHRITPNKKLSRSIRNFNAWGGKRNYYSWGGKRNGNYLKYIPKFKPTANRVSNYVKRIPHIDLYPNHILDKGDINT